MDPNTIERISVYFVSTMGLSFLTVNMVTATVRPFDDSMALLSIFYTFPFVILLFVYLALFNRLVENSHGGDRLKVAIWVLATTLSVMSASRVSMILPLSETWWVWAFTGSISFSALYVFFIKSEQINGENSSNVEEV